MHDKDMEATQGRILIVDDDLSSLRLLTEILTERGHVVHPTSCGEMALRFVESTLPDLILLDIKMPGLNGFEVCRRLKADARTLAIPVIFITGLGDLADKVKGFQAGGVDYLTKPLQLEEVLVRVQTHLTLHALRNKLSRQNSQLQQEISERWRAAEAVRQQLNFQQTMMDTIPSPIFYKDRQGRYLGSNAAFESYIGRPRADILGRTVHDIAPRELADLYYEADQALFQAPGVQRYEAQVRYADGSYHDVFFTKGTFTDLEGNVAGLVGVMLDITERKRVEEELERYHNHLEDLVAERTAELARANDQLTTEIEERRRAEAALQEASEKLKFFAYSVAHDLKSPAIGIHGLTKRLSRHTRDVLDDKGRLYCDQILRVSEHIAALVDKVNVYISAKEARLSIEKVNVGEILQMLKEEFSAQLSLRRIDWRVPETIVEVNADRLSLMRVFRNFVDNSLKYGGERLSRIVTSYEESEDFHIFSVSDDGKGLKAEDCEKIFGVFQRNETSRGVEGAGLGLTIVREIAARHGGSVWVEPRTRKGTTFYLSIARQL